jgi:hypothetical protein
MTARTVTVALKESFPALCARRPPWYTDRFALLEQRGGRRQPTERELETFDADVLRSRREPHVSGRLASGHETPVAGRLDLVHL